MASKHIMSLSALLITLLVCVQSFGKVTAGGVHFVPGKEMDVTIQNAMPAVQLAMHCKSKDTDLNAAFRLPGQQFQWTFKINALETTLYYCFFGADGHNKTSFDVFNAQIEGRRCEKHVIWKVQDDGFYFKCAEEAGWEKRQNWP